MATAAQKTIAGVRRLSDLEDGERAYAEARLMPYWAHLPEVPECREPIKYLERRGNAIYALTDEGARRVTGPQAWHVCWAICSFWE